MTEQIDSNPENTGDVIEQFLEASRQEAVKQAKQEATRRKAFFVVTALAVVALLLATMALFSRRAAIQQMEQAQLRRTQAEGLIDFMLDDLKTKLDGLGQLNVLEDVSQKALDYFATLPEDQLTGESLNKLIQTLHRIGEVRLKQNKKDDALKIFQDALSKAENLAAQDPNNSDWQYQLVVSYYWMGNFYLMDHQPEKVLPYFERYLVVAVRMNQANPDDGTWQFELTCAFQNLAAIYDELGRWQEALELAERSLALTKSLSEKNPNDMQLKHELADSYCWPGRIYMDRGDFAKALQRFGDALEIQTAVVAQEPDNPDFRSRLQLIHRHLHNVYRYKGDVLLALDHVGRALEISQHLHQKDPQNQKWLDALFMSYLGMAACHLDLGESKQANHYLQDARSIVDSFDREDSLQRWKRNTLRLNNELTRFYFESSLPAQALMVINDTRPFTVEANIDLVLLVEHLMHTGRAYMRLGDQEKAESYWKQALEACQSKEQTKLGPLYQRALALLYLNRANEAKPLLEHLKIMDFKYKPFQKEFCSAL